MTRLPAAYLVVDARTIGETLLRLVPRAYQPRVAALGEPVLDRIGGYVRGQILSSLAVGAVLAIGMALLGVKYALLIGALVSVPLLAGGWEIVRRLYLADD